MFMFIWSIMTFILITVISLRLSYVARLQATKQRRIRFALMMGLFSAILNFVLLGGEWNCDSSTCLYDWSIH